MTVDEGITYPLQTDLPEPPTFPDAINDFKSYTGHYPGEIHISWQRKVDWTDYRIQGPPRVASPSIAPLPTAKDIDGASLQELKQDYVIAIKYEDMPFESIFCTGTAILQPAKKNI